MTLTRGRTPLGRRCRSVLESSADRRSCTPGFSKGDAVPVAKLAPTSLLFGMWDSARRGTKIVRLFNSEIRGHNVIEVPASGQFVSSVPRLEHQVTKDLSSEGLLDCPYSGLGGVIVKGGITRTVWLNVRGTRKLRDEGTSRLHPWPGPLRFDLPCESGLEGRLQPCRYENHGLGIQRRRHALRNRLDAR